MTRVRIVHGRIELFNALYDGEPFHAVFCDPPYGLSFMGKDWDHGVPGERIWRGVYRHLLPGASLYAFGGTRTHHRLMVAIEDAGFEIRDCLMYLYGTGFPKSHNISVAIDKSAGAEPEFVGYKPSDRPNSAGNKSQSMNGAYTRHVETRPATDEARRWDGYGTALKPAWEPVIAAMKPLAGTFAENALEHGVSGINVDAGRVPTSGDESLRGGMNSEGYQNHVHEGWDRPWRNDQEHLAKAREASNKRQAKAEQMGRWPANVVLDEIAGAMVDEMSGDVGGGNGTARFRGDFGKHGRYGKANGTVTQDYSDTGGASRFYYTAKAHRRERDAGLHDFEPRQIRESGNEWGKMSMWNGENGDPEWRAKNPNNPAHNHHPTVKPIELSLWICRMLLPPPGDKPRRLLVPFSGSGSEIIGAMLARWDEIVGVEMNREYVEIARARVAWWQRMAEQLRTSDIDRILQYAYPQDYDEPDTERGYDDLPLFG